MQLVTIDHAMGFASRETSGRISLTQLQTTRSIQKPVDASSREHKQLLVAEGAISTRILISTLLQRDGYHVHAAGSAEEVQEIVRQHGLPDLAILGLHLRDAEGAAVALDLRQYADIPVIFVTNPTESHPPGQKSSEDYLTKPFIAADLLARVRHRLFFRSTAASSNVEISVDERFRLNLAQQYARLDGERIELTPIETRLLDALYQHRGRVLSPGFLMNKAWNRRQEGTLRSLWVHIRRLRSKIEPDPQHPRYVMTVRGQGYCLPRRPELDVVVK
jgi:DNA-binding response OmpR family regulator